MANFLEVQFDVDGLNEFERSKISDGSHTFDELYRHRCSLFSILINNLAAVGANANVYGFFKTKVHSDGTKLDDWFLCGIYRKDHKDGNNGFYEQITYHLPNSYWNKVNVIAFDIAPIEFDGHNSNKTIERLESWFLAS